MATFVHELAVYIEKHHCTIDEALYQFDLRREGYLSPSEIRTILSDMRLSLSATHIDELISHFIDKRDDRIKVYAMKSYLRPKIAHELSKMLDQKHHSNDLNAQLIRTMVLYMRKNHLTVYDLYKEIDVGRDKVINRADLGRFLRKVGIKLDNDRLDELLDTFDDNKDGRVDFNEFVRVIKPFLVERMETTATVDEILAHIATSMKEKQVSLASLFATLDDNKDGFISRTELRSFMGKFGGPTDDEKIKEILNHFDHNGDNRISIKEFINVLKPYVEKAESSPTPRTKNIQHSHRSTTDPLRRKVSSLIKENYSNLEATFTFYSESSAPSYITPNNFRQVLKGLNLRLTAEEVDIILDQFVEYNKSNVNWNKFLLDNKEVPEPDLGLSRIPESQSFVADVTHSQHEDIKPHKLERSSTAKNVFGKISKALKERHISSQEAFNIFDRDRTGKISYTELK